MIFSGTVKYSFISRFNARLAHSVRGTAITNAIRHNRRLLPALDAKNMEKNSIGNATDNTAHAAAIIPQTTDSLFWLLKSDK